MTIDKSQSRRFVVSVLVPDRVGLLRDVAGVVFSLNGNIVQIRQTVVAGFFHLIFTSGHPHAVTPEMMKSRLETALIPDAKVTVLECRAPLATVAPAGARFVVMTRGNDKPGTIFAIASFLFAHGINIEDWLVEEDCGKVVYIAQVVIPEQVDFRKLQTSFKAEMSSHGLTAVLCHENIFRATNEIGPIKSLLDH